MSTTYMNPDGLEPSPAYNHIAYKHGTAVFLTGQTATDVDGTIVGRGDIEAQVEKTWANIRLMVESLGASMEDIVKLVTYTTSATYKKPIVDGKISQFEEGRLPGSTFLVVSELADPALLVEIEATVVIPASANPKDKQ